MSHESTPLHSPKNCAQKPRGAIWAEPKGSLCHFLLPSFRLWTWEKTLAVLPSRWGCPQNDSGRRCQGGGNLLCLSVRGFGVQSGGCCDSLLRLRQKVCLEDEIFLHRPSLPGSVREHVGRWAPWWLIERHLQKRGHAALTPPP